MALKYYANYVMPESKKEETIKIINLNLIKWTQSFYLSIIAKIFLYFSLNLDEKGKKNQFKIELKNT